MMRRLRIPEFLFTLYFWGVVLLRPLLQENLNSSTLILTAFVAALVCALGAYMVSRRDQEIDMPIVIMSLLAVVFLCDAVFRVNSQSFSLLYEFLYFGLIPVALLSKVSQVGTLLVYFSYASVLAFLLYGPDPLKGYRVFSDYMGYGYKLALPAFLGMFIGCHYLKIRWMIVFEIFAFLSLMMFANRSALLAAIIFIVLFFIISYPVNPARVFKRLTLFTGLVVLAYVNIDPLMDLLTAYSSEGGFRSYAIQKLNYFIASGAADEIFFSGRIHIWKQAFDMFLEQPVLGHGMGRFQHIYGYYPHNVFLDVIVTSGLLGLIVILYFVLRSSLVIIRSSGDVRMFSLLVLALWFPKLLFSMMFINDTAFWVFFVLYMFPFVKSRSTSTYSSRLGLVNPQRNFS